MKIYTLILMLSCASALECSSIVTVEVPSANVSDVSFPPTTGLPRKTAVYLPAGYNPADTLTRYPVLYILHQWSYNYTALELYYKPILDFLISTVAIQPIIAVMPDVSYFPYLFGFYTDFTLDGQPMNFETYITSDIVPYIDANFNTDTSSVKKRGISGYEWGGYGATKIGTKHSSLFGSFSSFLGELNPQQLLDAILGFLLLQIPLLQVQEYIAPTQHVLFSPFNQDICAADYLINLMWIFGASAAWSPLPVDPSNPGFLPISNPLFINQGLVTIPAGLTAPNADMSVNLPYDNQTNFISTVTTVWDLQRIYEITLNYTATLTSQDIWLGSADATFDPFVGAPPFIFINQPSTNIYANELTSLSITHTYQVYNGYIWVPSPSFLGPFPPLAYPNQIADQIIFHNIVFS